MRPAAPRSSKTPPSRHRELELFRIIVLAPGFLALRFKRAGNLLIVLGDCIFCGNLCIKCSVSFCNPGQSVFVVLDVRPDVVFANIDVVDTMRSGTRSFDRKLILLKARQYLRVGRRRERGSRRNRIAPSPQARFRRPKILILAEVPQRHGHDDRPHSHGDRRSQARTLRRILEQRCGSAQDCTRHHPPAGSGRAWCSDGTATASRPHAPHRR
jgi:hypothetical protein